MTRFLPRFVFALFTLVSLTLALARPAYATPVPPELMAKLATYAEAFQSQEKHLSYTLTGKFEVIDTDDKVTETKEASARVEATGGEPKVTVLKYTEDGLDKTADAQKEMREAQAKHKKKKESDKDLKMPILAAQQDRYTFDIVEQNDDGSHVRIQFTPKEPADNTVEGSAWVDATAGTVMSATFRLSKTSLFVHYIHFALEFGEHSSLGPALSKITVEGEGGILFLRRKFRGVATLSGYSVVP